MVFGLTIRSCGVRAARQPFRLTGCSLQALRSPDFRSWDMQVAGAAPGNVPSWRGPGGQAPLLAEASQSGPETGQLSPSWALT
jgi:hypothetical protein